MHQSCKSSISYKRRKDATGQVSARRRLASARPPSSGSCFYVHQNRFSMFLSSPAFHPAPLRKIPPPPLSPFPIACMQACVPFPLLVPLQKLPALLRCLGPCARKPKTLFDGGDDEVESPDARASPARRRAPPSAVADAARTLEALQESNDWPSRALPRAAAHQPDAGADDASPPRARQPLRRATAEERLAMLSCFHEDPQLHRKLACVLTAFAVSKAVDDDARFRCSVKWLAFGLAQPCSPPIPS